VLVSIVVAGCHSASRHKEQTIDQPEAYTWQKKAREHGSAVDRITQRILEKIDRLDQNIAVIEFSELRANEYVQSPKGKLISERLITNLVNSGEVAVIERGQLERVLEELKLNMQGIIDSSSAKEVGKVLGIDALITGTIIELKESSEINARMIDTESGRIMAAVTVQDMTELPEEPAAVDEAAGQNVAGQKKADDVSGGRARPLQNRLELEDSFKVLFRGKKFLLLAREAKREVDKNPDDLVARFYLGMSLVRINKKMAYTNAIEPLRFVVRHGEGHPVMRKVAAKNLVYALFKSGRRKEAKEAMKKLSHHLPALRNESGLAGIIKELDMRP